MNLSQIKLTVISSLIALLSLFMLSNSAQAQVDPSAYANGIKAIVEINSKGEIKAIKMAPPKFKTQLHRVAVKLSVHGNSLKMEPLGIINDTLLYLYIRQPYILPTNISRALKISNPNQAKLRKGMITINNRRKMIDLPTIAPLKMAGKK